MKRLKYEIPGLFLVASLILVSNEIEKKSIRYSVLILAILGITVLVFLITREIMDSISDFIMKREEEHKKMSLEFSNVIEKYADTQHKYESQLISVIADFKEITSKYMDKVDSLLVIQDSIVEEGKILNGEVKNLNLDVHKMLESFCTQINTCLKEMIFEINTFHHVQDEMLKETIASFERQNSKHEVNLEKLVTSGFDMANKNAQNLFNVVETTLETFCGDFAEIQKEASVKELENLTLTRTEIEEYLIKYEMVINEAKESLNALKAQVRVSLDSINKALQEHTEAIEDGLDDCVDEMGEKLELFSKEQENRDNKQNTNLNNEVKNIEKVISSQIGQALEANERLLEYIQQVQSEWTTLSRDEMAFLEKVWNE